MRRIEPPRCGGHAERAKLVETTPVQRMRVAGACHCQPGRKRHGRLSH